MEPNATVVDCPHCGRVGRSPRAIMEGTKIKCKGCGQSFAYRPATCPVTIEDAPAQNQPIPGPSPTTPTSTPPGVVSFGPRPQAGSVSQAVQGNVAAPLFEHAPPSVRS
jgi:hypothetical protein